MNEPVYLVTLIIEIPFEHETLEKAEERAVRMKAYTLESLPDAVVTYHVYRKGIFQDLRTDGK